MSDALHPHVNPIASRLSLRPPQRESLEILARVCDIIALEKGADPAEALAAIQAEFPSVSSFEREFPSICFALATGVGKTLLMGAFIAYLYRAQEVRNFFVLAPNLTIYNKLIADFTPNTPKYVFRGIAEFANERPVIITGDTYESMAGALFDERDTCKVNIFNISKINSEVRGGRSPRIKRMAEYIGQPYFNYLAGLDDLVLLMDESHRYRASAGVRAINDLKPILGLELTATPFVETNKGPVRFNNVIYDYALGRAMEDGFVKEPAVVTRKDFNPAGMAPEEIERLKLEDGVRLHESVKVDLETYARETDNQIVKPFLLVIARDTTHAGQLLSLIQSDTFFEGRYKDKVIQVDSSMTGAQEDEMIQRLLAVESTDEPTEIVIHVNMLKEGWDVTNLYTIVPLRAANARTLIEQSIGRGLRLPYGKRTGVIAVDRLNIVAHDKFQEIIEEANRPGSTIRLQQVVLGDEQLAKTVTVVAQSQLASALGVRPPHQTSSTVIPQASAAPAFTTPAEQQAGLIAYEVMRRLENRPEIAPSAAHLKNPQVQEHVVEEVARQFRPAQPDLPGIKPDVDIAAIVAKTAALMADQTIDIPRILVVPTGEVRSGFKPFTLNLESLRYQAPSEELWIQHLRTNTREVLALGKGGIEEVRLEDFVVSGLVDFDDVSYDDHAELLYELASQVVQHLRGYLSEDDTRKVLRCYQRPIAQFVNAQMQEHYWEEASGYEVRISKGFTELKPCAYTAAAIETVRDFREAPADKSNMAKYLFGGFERCLYPVQKFHTDSERKLAVVLDRDARKWFRPAKGQFQIYYRSGGHHAEYQPDFVAETDAVIYMLEPKRSSAMEDADVLSKCDAAVKWCAQASDYSKSIAGKPWQYILVPHDAIASNMTIGGLASRYGVGGETVNA